MVYKHTNFNPLTWWRPAMMTLGLLVLMGSFSDVRAQCGISVSSADGTTTAPDGSTVGFIDFSPALNNAQNGAGTASLRRADINNRITSTGCNNYLFFRADGTPSNNADRDFNCDDLPGGIRDASGRFYFVRIDDNGTVDANTSSFVGIRITQVMDNLGPQISIATSFSGTVNCDVSRDPYDSNSPFVLCSVDNSSATCTSFNVTDNCTSNTSVILNSLAYNDIFDQTATTAANNPIHQGIQVFNRVWTVTDENGNMGTTSQQITVQDQQDPIFVSTASVPLVVSPTDNTPVPAYPRTDAAGNAVSPPTMFVYRTMKNLTCDMTTPDFQPVGIDYCQTISNTNPFPPQAAPPVITPQTPSSTFNPLNAPNLATSNLNRYNYDETQTFIATDNFGNTQMATRRYEYRDQVPPLITSVHNSLGVPDMVNRTVKGNNPFDPNYNIFEDEYTVSGSIIVSADPNSCSTNIDFDLAATDACAANASILSYTFEVFQKTSNGGEVSIQTGTFSGGNSTINGFQPGTEYRVNLMVEDVTGNSSHVDVDIEVLSVNPVITCTTSTIQVTLNTIGQGSISADQVLGTIPMQSCGFNNLSYEIRDVADGAVLASGQSTNASNAVVNFDCMDASTTRTIEVKVTNNNGGSVICTREVQVVANSSTSISSATTVAGSSAANVADGQITVTTNGSSGPFTYTYSGPTSGTETGGSPFTITGLRTGTYSVNVSTNNGCTNTTVTNIFVPVDDPIGLTALCATAFTGGTIDIPITVSDFDNINSTEFTVTVSGGLTITSAVPNNLPQTTGVNMVGTNQVTFSWFVQDMNTTPSVSLADGTTILTITAQAPNTAGSYDVTISGSNTQPEPSATQNQGAGAAASTSITVNTTDCSGTIQTSPASISGNIKFFSPTGNGVNDVVLNLDTDGDKSTVMSSSTGEYSVLANPNSNVTLSPSRPHTSQAQLLHGVNGGDLVQIQRRILGLSNTVTGDPYRTIAADANGNNRVDGGDLVRIQRAILGLETSFVVPSWRFARSSQTFSNPDAPFNGLQETYTNNNLNSAVTVDFIGIKVGDADASASHPYRTTTEQGSDKAVLDAVDYRGSLPIRVADQQLKTGGIYEVAFTAQDFRDLLTYQTTIEFDTDVLAFEGIATSGKLVNLDADNFGLHRVKAGMITTVWYNAIAQSLVDGATIFTLRFRAKKGQRLSRVLEFTSNGISQMAMGSDYEPLQVDLTFGEATSLLPNFELRQNKPNPFDDETIISFELEESSFTTLIIMDINGRIIRTYQDNLTKGYHEIAVNRIDIPNAGVYFYQVMTATQKSATRKMVVLD